MQIAYDDIMAQLKESNLDYNRYDCFSKIILFKGGRKKESVPTCRTWVISIGYVERSLHENDKFF